MAHDKPVLKLVSTGWFVCKICYKLNPELKLNQIVSFAASRILNQLKSKRKKGKLQKNGEQLFDRAFEVNFTWKELVKMSLSCWMLIVLIAFRALSKLSWRLLFYHFQKWPKEWWPRELFEQNSLSPTAFIQKLKRRLHELSFSKFYRWKNSIRFLPGKIFCCSGLQEFSL